MLYKIKRSTKLSVIGNVEQQIKDCNYPLHRDDPNNMGNIYFKRLNEKISPPPQPILNTRAKKTDLIGAGFYGSSFRLLISTVLKEILEKEHHQGLQFIKTSIIHKKIEYGNYWLTNIFSFDMSFINYPKSSIQVDSLGNMKVRDIEIESEAMFEKVQSSLVLPERLFISKPCIKATTSQHLILLRHVSGGVGYYVSEKLKKEIEEAGCIGIDFEAVEQG